MIFGPIVVLNLAIAMLLFGYGATTAVLSQQLTRSWSVAFFVGSVVIAQPMLLHAMSDGTAEHLSLWLMPLFIASLWKSLKVFPLNGHCIAVFLVF